MPGAGQGTLLPQLEGGRVVDPEGADILWRKSSLSASGECVEVAWIAESQRWALRHSKSPTGPVLSFTQAEWDAFLGGVRLGEFDEPSATA
jgi:Domain of unknown function (DUF397)